MLVFREYKKRFSAPVKKLFGDYYASFTGAFDEDKVIKRRRSATPVILYLALVQRTHIVNSLQGESGADFHGKIHPRTSHPPSFAEYLSRFLAAGCPKPIGFPRKSGGWGVKPFGHGKGSNPKK